MNTRIILFLISIILSAYMSAQNPNLHIYLCFGQSNMEGQGAIEDQDLNPNQRFKVYQALDCPEVNYKKGTWRTAVPPLCQCHSGLSPADYFGRTMIENLPDSIEVGIVHVAIGGCDIRIFDKEIYQQYDSTYAEDWFVDKVKGYKGNPYKYLLELAKEAQKDGVIKGILLHQGETNTGDTNWPQYVNRVYTNLIEDLQLDTNSVPLLAGEVVHADQNGLCASMNEIIAQLPETISNAHVISSSECTAQEDNVHFNSAGYRLLGERYAYKMLELLGYTADERIQDMK